MFVKNQLPSLAIVLAFSLQPLGAQLGQQGRSRDLGDVAPPAPEATAYLSGVVRMDDDSTVPKETVAELVCGGFPSATDPVSPKGEFDIELSGSGKGAVDATRGAIEAINVPQANNLGVVDLANCVVRADLAGYTSTQIQLSRRSMFDSPDIGEVVLSRLEGIRGHALSPTIATAPKKAVQSYEWAVKEGQKPRSDLQRMAARLESAVLEDPGFAAAWDLLGQIRKALNLNQEAIEAFKQAVSGDPEFYPVYERLVPLLARSNDMPGAIQFGEKALELNPHLDEVRFFVSGAYLRSGDNAACIENALTMVETEAVANYPQAYQFLGSAYANSGDFASSAKYFRLFLSVSPNATAANPIQEQLDEWVRLGVIPPESETP